MGGGGEHGQVHADLGDAVLRSDAADPGDLVELIDLMLQRRDPSSMRAVSWSIWTVSESIVDSIIRQIIAW